MRSSATLLATSLIVASATGQRFGESHHDLLRKTHAVMTAEINEHRDLQGNLLGGFFCDTLVPTVNNLLTGTATCKCDDSALTCTFDETICSNSDGGTNSTGTCGRPQISVDISNNASIKACVLDMTHQSIENQDFCVSMDLSLDGCTAELNDQVCDTCSVCNPIQDQAFGIEINCRNVNAEAQTIECQSFPDYSSLISGIGGGGGGDAEREGFFGFVPDWEGYCSQLQETAEGVVQCDCSQASGADFFLNCQANATQAVELLCENNEALCDIVSSNVTVVNDTIKSVEACVDTEFTGGKLCADVSTCDDDEDKICGCAVSQNGVECTSCEVCDNGFGIRLDCSNLEGGVSVDQCQSVDRISSMSFIPSALARQVDQEDDAAGVDDGSNIDSATSSVYIRSAMGLVLVVAAILI